MPFTTTHIESCDFQRCRSSAPVERSWLGSEIDSTSVTQTNRPYIVNVRSKLKQTNQRLWCFIDMTVMITLLWETATLHWICSLREGGWVRIIFCFCHIVLPIMKPWECSIYTCINKPRKNNSRIASSWNTTNYTWSYCTTHIKGVRNYTHFE